jgi:molybdenum cofactor sulfurtransferase
VEIGIKHLDAVGVDLIHERVRCLTGWLLEELTALQHSTGVPLARIYGPLVTEKRGGAVTLNFYDKKNQPLDIRIIEQAASDQKISLRTGCFCNPGAGEIALQISKMELAACFSQSDHVQRLTYDDFRTCIDGKASGAVRISVGMVSNFEDVQAVLKFAEGLLE